ncbi:hypothetical protein GJV85_10465 [Sulfurimonas aquatica]|uniref:Uncharacterized protein n=1 Tax=Sulfurimonas aquatica TaxID=2672570 RepID=A0A975B1I1_9BACT|nr:hypothetical protein [Sulfurimonas aquatica]QSZ42514.1 hypothetical protein GJV85_10465 [Sulfurimonas aquatica]
MSRKIGLHIGGRRFDVDVADDFAKFLEKEMTKDFNFEGNNDIKIVLQSYVRKAHELYTQEQKIANILNTLDN